MHRTSVIDDADIISRRDNQQKLARKRKVAQRGYGEKSGWGNARMYVLQNYYAPRLLCLVTGTYVNILDLVNPDAAVAATILRAIATVIVVAPWNVSLPGFP